jgi:sulfate permease, SulP family
MPRLPLISLTDFLIIIPAGISLALLGSIDSLLTSLIVDKVTFNRHDSNKELLGQGVGNIVSGLIGGLPGAGATMRSVVNVQNGGRTNLSGIVHGLILLIILLGAAPIASLIPLATLAGILITVGISIIDYRGLKSVRRSPKDDVMVMFLVLGLTVFLDLITAVLVGLSLAAFLFCKRFAELDISEHGRLDSLQDMQGVIKTIPEDKLKEIYTYTFNGPLFFGEARNFNYTVSNLIDVKTMILNFGNVPLMDQTGMISLEDSVLLLEKRGCKVIFVGLNPENRNCLEKMGLIDNISRQNYFETFEAAISHLSKA